MVHPKELHEVNTSDAAIYTCVAYGKPVPHIFWMRNGSYLGNSPLLTITENLIYQSDFILAKSVMEMCSTQETDGGNYTCVANNSISTDSFNFSLSVLPNGRVGLLPFLTHH